MSTVIVWIIALEGALSFPKIVACVALICILSFPYARRIVRDDDNNNVEDVSLSAPSYVALLFNASLASLAKAAIYTGRNNTRPSST